MHNAIPEPAEHPWDTGSDGRKTSCRRTMSMKLVKNSRTFLAAICLVCVMLPLGDLLAQATIPPTPDIDSRARKKSTLTKEQKYAVSVYAELLAELRMTISDYRQYLVESESDAIKKYLIKMDKFVSDLDRNAYAKDREQLIDNLEIHLGAVENLEEYIRDSEEIFPMKTYRVVQSLRREITTFQDLLEDQIHGELADLEIDEAELQAQLRELSRSMAAIERNADRIRAEAERQAAISKVLSKEEIEKLTEQARKAAKAATKEGLRPPMPPYPPSTYFPDKDGLGGSGTSREMTGSLTVTDNWPIFITNRFGKVTVVGQPGKQLSAMWSLELQAGSRQQEKEFLGQANLKVSREKDGYHVTVILPETDNRSTRIVTSTIDIELPAANKVVVENSFGDVEVSDLKAGVDVTNSYGTIEVRDVQGPVNVSNSMGPLALYGVTGTLKLQNAYSPISVDDCSGAMTIDNAYAQVEVSDSKGNAVIRNSGIVSVENHTGNVDITNSFGPVVVEVLNGDLTVQNQFQPVSVTDIKGKVDLKNANSVIEISNVRGSLTANNTFGLISAEELDGPLRLINQNGNIALVLDEGFKGNSIVQTTFGNVDLTIPRTANALVRAKTTLGNITSYMPLQVNETGQSKSAVLRLGRAADSLSITAENASITISDK